MNLPSSTYSYNPNNWTCEIANELALYFVSIRKKHLTKRKLMKLIASMSSPTIGNTNVIYCASLPTVL
jgi:hypothetical protein